MKTIFLLISILLGINLYSQNNSFETEFNEAYIQFPEIPKGILEGVSFAQTRIQNIQINTSGCLGIPVTRGVMGLTENGQGYFRNNMQLISNLSGYGVNDIKFNQQINILSYAKSYSILMDSLNASADNFLKHELILKILSEIPWDHDPVNHFALNSFVYEVFRFMSKSSNQTFYNFPNHNIDLIEIFGETNFSVLSSSMVNVLSDSIVTQDGIVFTNDYKAPDYSPALWNPAPSCNFSSRSGTPVSAVTVHTIQGSYAGAISWAKNCSSNVSYHYVIRSSDGQVTQMVLEADKGWHVGSENPYTIGIEHEGYVSDPTWYTEAMYQSSANLVKDITISGYGINPLRTYYGAATSGSNVLGGCTKIKGHQHYPYQTHTDPGINWNWEKYYKLINNNPSVINYITDSGVFYDSGGPFGNYGNDERQLYLIQPPSASNITLNFNSFNLELNWDFLYIYDGNSTNASLIGIYTGNSSPGTIVSTGGSILVEFRSDCATTASGWDITWTSNLVSGVGDVTPPIALVNFSNDWKTTDFTASFSDQDELDGSGVKYKLYQVIDYDGADWRANDNFGFFSDNFDLALHTDWTEVSGVWNNVSGYLTVSDESNGNTNIYADLNQNDANVFLYHWAGRINGSGSNKRAGLHFMCIDPTLENRGNSYFVYFREDGNKVQTYKVLGDVYSLVSDVSFTINPNQWYDYKIVYNKNSGEIHVWVDNQLVSTWVDSSPLMFGNSISFRSGNCIYANNNLKIYTDRINSEIVTIGSSGEIRYQNQNPSTPSGRVKSIAIDTALNISSIAYKDVNVDWTPPSLVNYVNDGLALDIDVFTSNTSISANWSSAIDSHSEVAMYWYAIGTSPFATDVLNWTENWTDTLMTKSGLSLINGTVYYVSVRSENGAGLFSDIVCSNGQLLELPVDVPTADFNIFNSTVCGNLDLQIFNQSLNATNYFWSISGAIPSTSTDINPMFNFPSSGTYTITLEATGPGGTDTQIQDIDITVENQPVSSFSVSNNIVEISNSIVFFTNNSSMSDGYLWDFGDGAFTTDTNPWHQYTSTGTFVVKLIAINGVCPNDTSTTEIVVVDELSISEFSKQKFKFYPNPVNNQLIIDYNFEATKNYQIQITDMKGSLISEVGINNQNQDKVYLDENHLPNAKGIYLIKIISDEEILIEKFVKN